MGPGRRLEEKRLACLLLAVTALALGFDALVAHFAGKDGADHPAQWAPILLSPASFLLFTAAALAPRESGFTTWTLRSVGVADTLVGLAGEYFHAHELFRHLDGERTFDAYNQALAVAPPVFAPAGFTALGIGALLLASRRFALRFEAPFIASTTDSNT